MFTYQNRHTFFFVRGALHLLNGAEGPLTIKEKARCAEVPLAEISRCRKLF